MQGVPAAALNGIEIFYEEFGDSTNPALMLVNGLGGQAIDWELGLIEGLTDRGFRVIRFDNRDAGLSSKIDSPDLDLGLAVLTALQGQPVDAPYLLGDLAADAVALLDHLGIGVAHVLGVSMGGMIAQTLAIEHPTRVLSLTSIMSTTGEADYGAATPEAAALLIRPAATSREQAVANYLDTWKTIGTKSEWDEARTRARGEAAYDRCYLPAGVGRQLLAILASGSRADALAKLEVPTLVIHGTADPLVAVSGGERTAELVPGARLLLIEDMGHDLPAIHWPQIIEAVTSHAARAESEQGAQTRG